MSGIVDTNYIEWRKHQNIHPIFLENKGKFFLDLVNIEHSWSGRQDIGDFGNTFVVEAEQQLVNALELFEQGFFDCAYYALRSSVELSTTMVYLADMPEGERQSSLEAWREIKDFPMQSRMIKLLSENGNIFIDMKSKMPDFFVQCKELSAELNKYVHKQGFYQLYVTRNHPYSRKISNEKFVSIFENHFRRCVCVVAVMRLAIDPFPILLMDEEILYRCFDSMTEPYSADFVEEYIGNNTIEAYKTTDLYVGTYEYFIKDEKKSEPVFNVVKNQYIDSREMDSLLSQLHLMTIDDAICTLIVYACDKIVKLYTCQGLLTYFTEKNTNRKELSWSTAEFKKFSDEDDKINQPFGEAYISVFIFNSSYYYAEHNDLLVNEDLARIVGIVAGALSNLNET